MADDELIARLERPLHIEVALYARGREVALRRSSGRTNLANGAFGLTVLAIGTTASAALSERASEGAGQRRLASSSALRSRWSGAFLGAVFYEDGKPRTLWSDPDWARNYHHDLPERRRWWHRGDLPTCGDSAMTGVPTDPTDSSAPAAAEVSTATSGPAEQQPSPGRVGTSSRPPRACRTPFALPDP